MVLLRVGYKWSGIVDMSLTPRWESVLLLAEKFDMRRVAKVACFALGRAKALEDLRKITLCQKYSMGKDWVFEELKGLVAREQPLSRDEGQGLGTCLAIVLAAAREKLRKIPPGPRPDRCIGSMMKCHICGRSGYIECGAGAHYCRGGGYCGSYICPALQAYYLSKELPDAGMVVQELDLFEPQNTAPTNQTDEVPLPNDTRQRGRKRKHADSNETAMPPAPAPASASTVTVPMKGDLYFQIQDSLFCTHSFHLKRASNVFADMLSLQNGDSCLEGKTEDQPIVLPDVKVSEFRSLLWFLYDSSYEWSCKADPCTSKKWEEVLKIADMFDMDEVCRVAIYALDHNVGLSDIRKISLCVRHDIDKTWTLEAMKNVCLREEPITKEEARDLGVDMTSLIAAARETAFKKVHGAKIPVSPEVMETIVQEILFQ